MPGSKDPKKYASQLKPRRKGTASKDYDLKGAIDLVLKNNLSERKAAKMMKIPHKTLNR